MPYRPHPHYWPIGSSRVSAVTDRPHPPYWPIEGSRVSVVTYRAHPSYWPIEGSRVSAVTYRPHPPYWPIEGSRVSAVKYRAHPPYWPIEGSRVSAVTYRAPTRRIKAAYIHQASLNPAWVISSPATMALTKCPSWKWSPPIRPTCCSLNTFREVSWQAL